MHRTSMWRMQISVRSWFLVGNINNEIRYYIALYCIQKRKFLFLSRRIWAQCFQSLKSPVLNSNFKIQNIQFKIKNAKFARTQARTDFEFRFIISNVFSQLLLLTLVKKRVSERVLRKAIHIIWSETLGRCLASAKSLAKNLAKSLTESLG